jgi:hypothetical protein
MQAIKIILFSIIGLFLGIVFSNVITSGYFERWKVSHLPQDYIVTRFVEAQNTNLIVTKPCDYSEPEFFIFTNSPKNIEDCLQIKMLYPEGEGRETFVRDSNGNIWEWSHVSHFQLNELVCYPFSGLLIGLVIAVATKELTKIQNELGQKQKDIEQKQKMPLE